MPHFKVPIRIRHVWSISK